MRKFIVLYLILIQNLAFSDWIPEYVFYDFKDSFLLESLNSQSYRKLKHKVVSKSSNGISHEKIELLMDLMFMIRPKVCVEIGVGKGCSLLPIAAALRHLKHGKLLAIDAWSNEVVTQYLDPMDPNRSHLQRVKKEKEYKKCLKIIDEWSLEKYCKILRKTSEDAARKVDTIDFLHLDGDYSEIGSMKDVEVYLPKIKSGGYILLSNFYITVNGNQPKLRALGLLFDSCEMVCGIENDNAILFRKL